MSETKLTDAEYFDAILHELDNLASNPPAAYWFDEDPECADYCYNCIVKTPGGDQLGGGYCFESDGFDFCAGCGCLLDGVLTDYGVKSELEHFLAPDTAAWEWNNPDHCFEIARIVRGVVGGGWYDFNKIDPKMRRDLLRLMHKGNNVPMDTLLKDRE